MNSDEPCTLILGKRDEEGRSWCRTCGEYVHALPRSERAKLEGKQPRLACPREPA